MAPFVSTLANWYLRAIKCLDYRTGLEVFTKPVNVRLLVTLLVLRLTFRILAWASTNIEFHVGASTLFFSTRHPFERLLYFFVGKRNVSMHCNILGVGYECSYIFANTWLQKWGTYRFLSSASILTDEKISSRSAGLNSVVFSQTAEDGGYISKSLRLPNDTTDKR